LKAQGGDEPSCGVLCLSGNAGMKARPFQKKRERSRGRPEARATLNLDPHPMTHDPKGYLSGIVLHQINGTACRNGARHLVGPLMEQGLSLEHLVD
jgi:hypothetical protein